jgi:hypothetical protein
MLVAFAISARGGIDLTPSVSEYTAEGNTFRQLTFADGKRQVVYELPRLWSYRGDRTSLHLSPSNVVRADASIQVTDLPKPQPLNDTVVAALKEQSLHAAPPGAQSVTLVAEEMNPVRLEGGDAYCVTISYQALGETFVRSALYVNLPDAQLIFRLTARKADFEPLQRAFRSSILSWHWVDPAAAESRSENQAQKVTAR